MWARVGPSSERAGAANSALSPAITANVAGVGINSWSTVKNAIGKNSVPNSAMARGGVRR